MDAHPGHIKEISTRNPFIDFQRLQEFPEIPEIQWFSRSPRSGSRSEFFLCGLSRYAQMMLREKKFGEKDPLVSTQDPEDPFLELQGI